MLHLPPRVSVIAARCHATVHVRAKFVMRARLFFFFGSARLGSGVASRANAPRRMDDQLDELRRDLGWVDEQGCLPLGGSCFGSGSSDLCRLGCHRHHVIGGGADFEFANYVRDRGWRLIEDACHVVYQNWMLKIVLRIGFMTTRDEVGIPFEWWKIKILQVLKKMMEEILEEIEKVTS